MKCPNCGFELAAEQLYCEKCGGEIQIVPDFEPEIENSIIETLSTVAEEIELEQEVQKPESHKKPNKLHTEEQQNRSHVIIGIGSFIGVLVIILVVGIQMYHIYSVSYQIDQAEENADAGNYLKAAEYMEKADGLSPDNAGIRYTMANYYYLHGDIDKSVSILVSMTQSERYTVEEKEKCYEKAIAILDEQKNYQKISDLLKNCEDEILVTQFQHYLAMEPEFSVPSGNYGEVIPLKLSSNTSGKIYYTLNGSKPTQDSKVYVAPIFLETGDYVVSAMFVNDYGIESEIVRNSYHIDLLVPDPPKIALYSGLYVEPTMIEVTLPETGEIYYTTNGNIPTIDSNHYTEPIEMPLGRTEFNFITISDEGVPSDVVRRNFEFRLMTSVTTSIATKNIMEALVSRRVLTDMSGKAFGMSGSYEYSFNSFIEIPGKGYYYKFDEFYKESDGVKIKTEHLYAVEVYTGTPNRLIYNELGEMDLISLD